jgi:DNA-binding NtrC family response regulator
MMSGHATIDTAVEATKIGAMAFLEKPITLQKLLKAVEQGLSKTAPRKPAAPEQQFGAALGRSHGRGRDDRRHLAGAR